MSASQGTGRIDTVTPLDKSSKCPSCGHEQTGEAWAKYVYKRAAKRGEEPPPHQCMVVLHDYGFGDAEYCECTFAHSTTR